MIRFGPFIVGLLMPGAMAAALATAAVPLAATFDENFAVARRALTAGRYLQAERMLRPFALDDRGAVADRAAFGIWNQVQAMLSGMPRAATPPAAPDLDAATRAAIAAAIPHDPLRTIVAAARRTRIVILNENHVTPCQRAFGTQVARALRPLGYDVLLAETFAGGSSARMAALAARGYPVLSDGFYLKDPMFGDLVRTALALGYRPAAYEAGLAPPGLDAAGAQAFRERTQAENIVAELRRHPGARMLIYSGGSHLAERPVEDGLKMMGQWLAELSGIDPLTIDQNGLQPLSSYHAAYAARGSRKDAIFLSGGQPLVLGSLAGKVDLQVYARAQPAWHGRPGCLTALRRRPRAVPRALWATNRARLVQVFGIGERADAVPLDQVLSVPGRAPPPLMTASRRVTLALQD